MSPKKKAPPVRKAPAGKPTVSDKAKAAAPIGERAENQRRKQFVREYLIDLNGGAAAIRAGYMPSNARDTAHHLLGLPEIRAAVEEAMAARSARTEITQDKVLQRLWAVATADSSELIELRRTCCRYCWGRNNRYQRTSREMDEALREFERSKLKAEARGEDFPAEFDEQGGLGFDARKDPNPKCVECHGEGVETVRPRDTRDLSPAAKLLYAGVKTTQHGLEIKVHDQMAALQKVGQHLGMFEQRLKHSNDPENPIQGVVMIPAKVSADGSGAGE